MPKDDAFTLVFSDVCDCCGEHVKSPYTFQYNGVWYGGHKRCMGAPMLRKMQAEGQRMVDAVSPQSPVNIALTGRLRSGKDSVAAYLVANYGYTRFAFGDELKRYYHELFGETKAKPREGYQWFGQTMRQRDPAIWTRKCFDAIKRKERSDNAYYDMPWNAHARVPFRAVISDLRQPNEFTALKSAGYVIIRVNAPEGVRINRAVESADTFNYADLRHETESHVDTFAVDYEIYNTGTLDELYTQIDGIMAGLGVEKTK